MDLPKPDGSLARLTDEELLRSALVWAARLRRAASIHDLDFVSAPMTPRSKAVQDLYAGNFADRAFHIAAEIVGRRGFDIPADDAELSERDAEVGMAVIGQKHIVGHNPLQSAALVLEFLARKLAR